MKTIFLFLSVLVLFACDDKKITQKLPTPSIDQKMKITTYYLIRHAEKDRTDSLNRNPGLTPQGNERAKRWAALFKNIPFDAVYSTPLKRTMETATPTALQNHIKVISYEPKELLEPGFKTRTAGKTVLIVGHSNTVPQTVNALIGEDKYKFMDDADNATLYIVTLSGDSHTVQVLFVD